jgi:membrane associated rhomboid family serine protease
MRLPDSWKTARVTVAITAVTIAAWIFLRLSGMEPYAWYHGAFIADRAALGVTDAAVPFWLTPLTSALLHAGPVHLAFNMMILLFCGRPVESVLGPVGLAILYLLGAYAAAAAQYAIDPAAAVPMVGASGAISAVIGAYAMLFGRNKVKLTGGRLDVWLNALWLMAAWVVLQVIIGLTISSALDGLQVAVGAHVGGFLVGILLANPLLLFRYRRA